MRDKERTFHKLSPFISRTLAFILCTTLFPIKKIYKKRKIQKRKKKNNEPKLKKGEETTLKTTLKTPLPENSGNLGHL